MVTMLIHPQWNPIALQLGPLAVHWYGISYLAAFGLFFFLALRRSRQPAMAPQGWSREIIEDLLFYGVLGGIFGGRLGYCLFYKPGYYALHPLEVLALWQGGMSFHGGMLGVIGALALYGWQRGKPWLQVTDFVAPCVPTGLAAGRVGNFINGELWGRAADPSLPWAMVFPGAGPDPRHPSQLYQAGLEGLCLFILLMLLVYRPAIRARAGVLSGVFLAGYGVARFIGEFFRQPDAHLGFLFAGATMGQLLSLPMMAVGAWLVLRGMRRA